MTTTDKSEISTRDTTLALPKDALEERLEEIHRLREEVAGDGHWYIEEREDGIWVLGPGYEICRIRGQHPHSRKLASFLSNAPSNIDLLHGHNTYLAKRIKWLEEDAAEIAHKMGLEPKRESLLDAAVSYYTDSSNRFKFERLWGRITDYYSELKKGDREPRELAWDRDKTGYRPCPFCRSDNIVLSSRSRGWLRRRTVHFWRCLSCEARGPETEIRDRAYGLWVNRGDTGENNS